MPEKGPTIEVKSFDELDFPTFSSGKERLLDAMARLYVHSWGDVLSHEYFMRSAQELSQADMERLVASSRRKIETSTEIFPQGHSVVLIDGNLAGFIRAMRFNKLGTWNQTSHEGDLITHDPYGKIWGCLAVQTDRELREKLRETVPENGSVMGMLVEDQRGKFHGYRDAQEPYGGQPERLVAFSGPRGFLNYIKSHGIDLNDALLYYPGYIRGSDGNRRHPDPVIGAHKHLGAVPAEVIVNGRPMDYRAMGMNQIMQYFPDGSDQEVPNGLIFPMKRDAYPLPL